MVHFSWLNPCLLQAVGQCVDREALIVLFASEPFFLSGRHDLAINDNAGSRVVVVSGNANNLHWQSEQGIDKWCEHRALRQYQQPAYEHHDNKDRQQPKLLAHSQERPEFLNEIQLGFLKIDS